jgi:hypothetical protein
MNWSAIALMKGREECLYFFGFKQRPFSRQKSLCRYDFDGNEKNEH